MPSPALGMDPGAGLLLGPRGCILICLCPAELRLAELSGPGRSRLSGPDAGVRAGVSSDPALAQSPRGTVIRQLGKHQRRGRGAVPAVLGCCRIKGCRGPAGDAAARGWRRSRR